MTSEAVHQISDGVYRRPGDCLGRNPGRHSGDYSGGIVMIKYEHIGIMIAVVAAGAGIFFAGVLLSLATGWW